MKIIDSTLFRAINLMVVTFTLLSCIRGCHVYNYKDVWDPSLACLGESIHCKCEYRNPQDPYAA